MLNALTIDVEEHYHLCGLREEPSTAGWHQLPSLVVAQTERLLDLLRRKQVKATFFVLGSVAQRWPDLIQRIAREGHEIGSHGYTHRLIYQETPQEFEEDLRRALDCLTPLVRRPVIGYRAPSFSITKQSLWALGTLARLGFRYDCSVFPIQHPRYGIPDAPRTPHPHDGLVEFPLSTIRLGPLNIPVAGGAYFRLLPLWFISTAFRMLNRHGIPVQFYLHPWELDDAVPRLPMPWHRALTHYVNLDKTAKRFAALLDEFAFGPVHQVLGIHVE